MIRSIRSRLLNVITSLQKAQGRLWLRSPVLGALAWFFLQVPIVFCHVGITLICTPYVVGKSPTSSFSALARTTADGVIRDSYQQHLRYYRASVLSSITTFAVVALYVISIFAVSFFAFGNPKTTQAASEHMIGFFAGAVIPDGWTCVSCTPGDPFHQTFLRGSATYGSTGGATTYSHTVAWASSSNAAVNNFVNGTGTSYGSATHKHNSLGSGSTDAVSSLPVYQDIKVIQSNGTGDPPTLPLGFIGMFDATPPPAGWTQISTHDGDFLRGMSGATGTGGTATHTHTASITTGNNGQSAGLFTDGNGTGTVATSPHTHTGTGTTASGTHTPLYRDVILASADDVTTIPDGLIAMYDATPSAMWTVLSGTGGVFDSRFIRANATPGGTGGAATHTHSNLAITTNPTSSTVESHSEPTVQVTNGTHTHDITVSFGVASNLPPYTGVIIAQYAAGITVAGNVLQTNESTAYDCSANNLTINVSVNGGANMSTTCTAADGSYTVTVPQPSAAGDPIVVSIDSTESVSATTVTLAADTSSSIAGLNVIQERVVVRHEDAGPVTNAKLATGDNGDAGIRYGVATSNLTLETGIELHVWTGDTFTPGGTVTTQGMGSLHLDDNATVTLGTATNAIAGDIVADTGTTLTVNADTTVAGGDITTAGTATVTHASGTPTITVSGTGSIGGGSNTITAYNLTLSGTPTLASDLSIKNALVLPASVTAGSTTVTMTGTSGTITGGGATLANLTINPTSAGTVTLQTSDLTVSGTLVVAADDTLSLESGRTLTHSGATLTLTGTISGAGRLTYTSTTAFPTTGTISSILRFDATNGNQTMSVRTYNDDVEVVNTSDINARTVTMGNSTITIFGSLTIAANGSQDVTLDADLNDAYPYIDEDFDFTGTGAGSERVLSGGQTWTMVGNVDLTGGTYVTSAATLFIMSGTGKTLTTAGNTLRNVNIYGSTTLADSFTMDGDLYISGTLNAAGQAMTVGGSWDNQGTFTPGGNTVTFNASGAGKTIVAGVSSFNNLEFNNAAGGWTIQTNDMTVGGNLILTAATSLTLQSGRTLTVTGNFTNSAPGVTTWTGSTLYLNGSGGLQTINTKGSGDTYATLRVGASEDVAMWDSSAGTVTTDAGGCLLSQDDAGTAGRLNIYGTCNSRANEYWSYATDFDGTALGGASRQVDVRFADGASFTVDSGDTLAILGQSLSANRTLITRQSSGNFGLTIAGTISAQYFDVDYLNASGLSITSTATVSTLADGSFDNNASGATSSYITVTGITATQNFTGFVFDATADGTDANVVYNVNADGSGIAWSLLAAGGNRAGESYDREVNGASVLWSTVLATVNDGLTGDADYSNASTSLSVNWTVTDDTGIDHYEYAIGTTLGGSDVKAFTNAGVSTVATASSLSLSNGTTYYATVRAENAASEVVDQASSDGILVDTEAATFTSIAASPTTTSATISWTSSEGTTTRVQYGLTTSYGSETTEVTTLATSHSATITGLTVGQTYHYRVVGTDRAGNTTTSSDQTFVTSSIESTVITNVQTTVLSPTSVTVTWTTNHLADSKVRYGTTTAYGSEVYDATLVTSHSLTITDLTPNTTYHYEVLSVGNTSTNDADATFVTSSAPATVAGPTGVTVNDAPGDVNVPVDVDKKDAVVVSGTVEPNAQVTLTVVGTDQTFTTTSSATGAFSFTLRLTSLPLDFGTYTLSLTVTKGGASVTSTVGAFTISSPVVLSSPTITVPKEGADLAGQPIVIRGLARSGNLIRLFVDGELVGRTIATENDSGTGTFFFHVTKELATGTHTIIAVAIDGDGIASANTERTFLIGHPFVTPTLFAPIVRNGGSPSVTLYGMAWENSTIHVELDGKEVATFEVRALTGQHTAPFTYTLPLTGVSAGMHSVVLIAADFRGKLAEPTRAVTFEVGTSAVISEPSFSFDESVSYSVKAGDSLWSIAERFLGDGGRYSDIAVVNAKIYPSLATAPSVIQVGWVLQLPSQ